ncbi:MAG: hypothetical protein ACTSU2_12890 [Promethearchaeota archaeon]
MSLKEETKGIFTRYGLTDDEINVLLAYLGLPQATASMIADYLEMDLQLVQNITAKLVKEGFLREIEDKVGINRYIPLEPYFSLFVKESQVFREEIEKIKDAVLEDQSNRFNELEDIKSKAIDKVNTAVQDQIDDFFKVSDEHDADKKAVIEKARDRFTDTSKTLEKDIHNIINSDYNELESDVNQMDADSAALWDQHSSKFTQDNNDLNAKLDEISNNHVSHTEDLEKNLHGIIDNLNSQLKSIADGFISKYEQGINEAKDGINNIISDLLKDYAERVNKLETEIKKDLDQHVENHKKNAEELKPTLESILEKYMARMHDVIEDLKRRITKLLFEHIDHLKSTTDKMQASLKDRVENRQNQLEDQVKSFEENTIVLIDNLSDIANKLSELAEVLASRGSAFKALFIGKHKQWVELNNEIQERISKISGSMKDDFTASTSEYMKETAETKEVMKKEIEDTLVDENGKLKGETEDLDKKAQETVNAELEDLAKDLSTEIDNTMKGNIQHCKDTTVKLKDSVQSSFATHKADYDAAINRHLKKSLDYYSDCDKDVKNKVDSWYSEMDIDHNKAKNDISTETNSQIADIKKHLEDTKNKNIEHSKTFEKDKEDTKAKQKEIYTTKLQKIRKDFDDTNNEVSEKINAEIELFKNECAEMDEKLHNMLEDHKAKYNENATSLRDSLNNTISENTQNTKDAIAAFTLQFMQQIDDANELALNNEDKLNDILKASASIVDVPKATTWHVIGKKAIYSAIIDALSRVKSSIIIVTHEVVPKILEAIGTTAYNKKSIRFFYTTHWTPEYNEILTKMKRLGNIQFRQLKSEGDFIAMTKDAEEVVLAPVSKKEEEIIGIVSNQEGYCTLYSKIIGPVFQANSRPI